MDTITKGAMDMASAPWYTDMMRGLLDSFFTGGLARVTTIILIGMALWFSLRREQLVVGFVFMAFATFLMFGNGIMRWLGMA